MKSTSIKDIFTSIKKLPSAFRESSNAFIERFANYCGLQGWRLEVATSIFIALVSLGLNVGFYIYSRKHDSPGPDGLGVFDKGHCSSINWWNRVAHVAINILSTVCTYEMRIQAWSSLTELAPRPTIELLYAETFCSYQERDR